jgi:regulatory protein
LIRTASGSAHALDRSAESAAELSTRAYRWLARRDRSRAEMRAYLERYCSDANLVARLLDELAERGWLSEARLAEQMIRTRRARGGAQRIRYEMARRGIPNEVIAQSTAGLEAGDLPLAIRLLRRRFREPPADRDERERQLRFLLNRGFDRAIARKALQAGGGEDAMESDG